MYIYRGGSGSECWLAFQCVGGAFAPFLGGGHCPHLPPFTLAAIWDNVPIPIICNRNDKEKASEVRKVQRQEVPQIPKGRADLERCIALAVGMQESREVPGARGKLPKMSTLRSRPWSERHPRLNICLSTALFLLVWVALYALAVVLGALTGGL